MEPRRLVGWKIAGVQYEKDAVVTSLKEASACLTQDTLETKTEFAIERTMADCKIKGRFALSGTQVVALGTSVSEPTDEDRKGVNKALDVLDRHFHPSPAVVSSDMGQPRTTNKAELNRLYGMLSSCSTTPPSSTTLTSSTTPPSSYASSNPSETSRNIRYLHPTNQQELMAFTMIYARHGIPSQPWMGFPVSPPASVKFWPGS